MTTTRTRRSALACLTLVLGELALHAYWIAGGRWAYTACDRTDLGDHPTGGCGAAGVAALPFWAGWGAVGVFALLGVLIGYAVRVPGRAAAVGSWTAAVVLALAAFPLNLLFEVPAALAGHPSDWRDLGARTALLVGGVLFARLASAVTPVRVAGVPGYRPVPRWTRHCAYVAVAVPVVGWAIPHGLWLADVPFGISSRQLAENDLDVMAGLALTVVPPLFGLLCLGLVQRWGQEFPRWVPRLRGRRIPPLLAVVPASLVAAALITYGVFSFAALISEVRTGESSWTEVRDGWAVTATLVVFLGWGVALGATTVGYARTTR